MDGVHQLQVMFYLLIGLVFFMYLFENWIIYKLSRQINELTKALKQIAEKIEGEDEKSQPKDCDKDTTDKVKYNDI